jgi:hypothetical protein
MPNIGLAHAFKPVGLNQFHNALKAGSNIKRKAIKRLSDLFVQGFNGPCHFSILYLFCNMGRAGLPTKLGRVWCGTGGGEEGRGEGD